MAKKKNKTGLIVLLIICGIVIGVIASVIVMTLLNKNGAGVKESRRPQQSHSRREKLLMIQRRTIRFRQMR